MIDNNSKFIITTNEESAALLIKTGFKLMNQQEPTHKHFACPKCKQMVRVPKGHGKIVITCPNCKNKFEKRS